MLSLPASRNVHEGIKIEYFLLRTAAPVLLSIMEHRLSFMILAASLHVFLRFVPLIASSVHAPRLAVYHARSPSFLPFISTGVGFEFPASIADRSVVGAFALVRLNSSIDLITGAAVEGAAAEGAAAEGAAVEGAAVEGAAAEGAAVEGAAAEGAGAEEAATAALMAATVGEGAKDCIFWSQQCGPMVQPSIL